MTLTDEEMLRRLATGREDAWEIDPDDGCSRFTVDPRPVRAYREVMQLAVAMRLGEIEARPSRLHGAAQLVMGTDFEADTIALYKHASLHAGFVEYNSGDREICRICGERFDDYAAYGGNEGYTRDGHRLLAHVYRGDVELRLWCPGAPACRSLIGVDGDGECNLKLWFAAEGWRGWSEWQKRPYREAPIPCEIEWKFTGWDDAAELWWRPVTTTGGSE